MTELTKAEMAERIRVNSIKHSAETICDMRRWAAIHGFFSGIMGAVCVCSGGFSLMNVNSDEENWLAFFGWITAAIIALVFYILSTRMERKSAGLFSTCVWNALTYQSEQGVWIGANEGNWLDVPTTDGAE